MTQEDKTLFIEESIERGHRLQYERALAFMNQEGPDWDDLSSEKRAAIRLINVQHDIEIQKFGESLSDSHRSMA